MLHPLNLLLAIAGVVVGMTAGVLPGITGIMAMILLLPFTYKMAIIPALILLTAAYVGGVFGGTITAILFNIPGDPDSVPSLWDGHPMARAGQAGKAIGIAAFSAVIGGLGGTLVLTFLTEPFARVALQFSSTEFFSVVVFGLTSVTVLGAGSVRVAVISLMLGLLIGTVGLDDIYGQERFTFGSPILRDGIDFQAVLMGVYALAEVLERLSQRYPIATITDAASVAAKLPGIRELAALWPTLTRSTATGMVIGIIPGAGATIGAFVSYGIERLFARRRRLLGTGIPEGLAAPNAAANATIGGHFIPLLTLGIPGSGATAVILGAFLIKGVQPGPNIFTTSSELVSFDFRHAIHRARRHAGGYLSERRTLRENSPGPRGGDRVDDHRVHAARLLFAAKQYVGRLADDRLRRARLSDAALRFSGGTLGARRHPGADRRASFAHDHAELPQRRDGVRHAPDQRVVSGAGRAHDRGRAYPPAF